MYSGTVADFSATDSLIYRGELRTEQYDYKHLNGESPKTVSRRRLITSLSPFCSPGLCQRPGGRGPRVLLLPRGRRGVHQLRKGKRIFPNAPKGRLVFGPVLQPTPPFGPFLCPALNVGDEKDEEHSSPSYPPPPPYLQQLHNGRTWRQMALVLAAATVAVGRGRLNSNQPHGCPSLPAPAYVPTCETTTNLPFWA